MKYLILLILIVSMISNTVSVRPYFNRLSECEDYCRNRCRMLNLNSSCERNGGHDYICTCWQRMEANRFFGVN